MFGWKDATVWEKNLVWLSRQSVYNKSVTGFRTALMGKSPVHDLTDFSILHNNIFLFYIKIGVVLL